MGRKASTINLSEDERLYLETQMRARTIQAQTVIQGKNFTTQSRRYFS